EDPGQVVSMKDASDQGFLRVEAGVGHDVAIEWQLLMSEW
ncbi:MAG: hypothetical protein JWQ11_322, partial [Rhizobacter sp.]|nr:hypothetical protein [Rhizobacter sp.]